MYSLAPDIMFGSHDGLQVVVIVTDFSGLCFGGHISVAKLDNL